MTTIDDDIARQVTVFGVLATPGAKTVDSRLSNIHPSVGQVASRERIQAPRRPQRAHRRWRIDHCNLGNGYTLTTSLVKPLDENGKVELRCELFHDKISEFSTLVKTPVNQLFFCQRALKNGSQFLIGVGAR